MGGSDYIQPDELRAGKFLTSGCDANPERVDAAKKTVHAMSDSYKNEFPAGPEKVSGGERERERERERARK